jgi:4-amino-4-deoxy-L-arabinose transferase-like glycosyltransferase
VKGIGGAERICLVAAVIVALVYLYWFGAVEHLEKRNTDMGATDQRGYLKYAKNVYELIHEGEYFYGNRNRMPFYPFLQSFVYQPGLTDEEYFVRGKYFNIALSLLLLAGIFFIFRKYFPWPYTANLMLITAFTVFIFKAAYFHDSLTFFFLNFCMFLLMCKMLDNPSWKLGILTGVVLGVAHLTKASVSLGLGLFLLFSLAKVVRMLYVRLAGKVSTALECGNRAIIHRVLSVALVVVVFLVAVYPYIRTSKKYFGRYFYNVNTTFYMWYDSWDEVEDGTKAHGDRKGWPDMPPEEIPSAGKYLREHTARQIMDRIVNGLKQLNAQCRDSYGYYKYVLIYFAYFLVVVILNFRHNLKLAAGYPFILFFCLAYFVAYLLAYAWYTPIATGNRFILALFLPFMFSISYVICVQPVRYLPIRPGGMQIRLLDVLNALVFLVLVVDIYLIVTGRIVAMYGGR